MLLFYVVMIALALLIAVIQYFGSDKYKVRKALESTPYSEIATLRDGITAKVIGAVRALEGKVLTAPLSGRKCVFYEVIVEERVQRGKSHSWRERIRDFDSVDFELDDGTGVAMVSTSDMKQVSAADAEGRSGFLDDATPAVEAYLQRQGTSSVGLVFNKDMRYREAVFEVGERVAVHGLVVIEEAPAVSPEEGSYRGGVKRPCLRAPAGGHLMASDESRST